MSLKSFAIISVKYYLTALMTLVADISDIHTWGLRIKRDEIRKFVKEVKQIENKVASAIVTS